MHTYTNRTYPATRISEINAMLLYVIFYKILKAIRLGYKAAKATQNPAGSFKMADVLFVVLILSSVGPVHTQFTADITDSGGFLFGEAQIVEVATFAAN